MIENPTHRVTAMSITKAIAQGYSTTWLRKGKTAGRQNAGICSASLPKSLGEMKSRGIMGEGKARHPNVWKNAG